MASKSDDDNDGKIDDVMDNIFHSNDKAMDYANLGGGPRSGEARVDSRAHSMKTAKQVTDSENEDNGRGSGKGPQKGKISQNLPQIGALGAFAAMTGGFMGGVSSSASAQKDPKEPPRSKPVEDKRSAYTRTPSVLSGVGVPEIDERRKYSTQLSKDGDDEEFEFSPTVDTRGHMHSGAWESDEGHHFQANYAHAHHVMHKIRRKKKTSVCSDDGVGSDGEADHKKHGHGKRRGSKKEDIHHLPTIDDETKQQPARFGIGSATEQDDESELETFHIRRKKAASESSMGETEDEHNEKFSNLKRDVADSGKKKSVGFTVGQGEDSDHDHKKGRGRQAEEEYTGEEDGSKRKRKRSKKMIGIDDRRRLGSMVKMDEYAKMVADEDEADVLESRDMEDMAVHRMDRMGAYARPKISKDADMVRVRRKKKSKRMEVDGGETTDAEQKFVSRMYGLDPADEKHLDRTPHDIFVQLSELNEAHTFWEEKSRWIKYEECKEEGAERWGRPHLSSLSFHSLINLRLALEKAVLILDFDHARDFTTIAFKVAEECVSEGFINDDQLKSDLLRLLLIRHKFVDVGAGGTGEGDHSKWSGLKRSLSRAKMSNLTPAADVDKAQTQLYLNEMDKTGMKPSNGNLLNDGHDNGTKGGLSVDLESGGLPSAAAFASLYQAGAQTGHKHGILHRLKPDTEGTITLVGYWEYINEPLCVLVRLAEGVVLPNTIEVPIPVRFIFLLLTPDTSLSMSNIDPHEVGRSFSTMMSNPTFHNDVYQFTARKQLLSSINDFLDASVVLPSGEWDSKNLISMDEIKSLRTKKQDMKALKDQKDQPEKDQTEKAAMEKTELKEKKQEGEDDGEYDPLKRGRYPFSGMINDIKHRYPHYLSDFVDGLNGQVLAATIFIYFAALSGAVAFGGLTGDSTNNQIGVSETMIVSAVSGVLYSLFAGQPLIITGLTGPILLYDQSLWAMAEGLGIDFLQWRVWIGIWLSVIAVVVAAFQGSVYVRYFSKFTKDIFASLVSLLFIISALKKLHKVFKAHPLYHRAHYNNRTVEELLDQNSTKYVEYIDRDLLTICTDTFGSQLSRLGITASPTPDTTDLMVLNGTETKDTLYYEGEEPNTALLSFILMFGTFMIAYGLKIFRTSHYFGRTMRKALGDFGVPIAIVLMVMVDFLCGDTYTKKLNVPFGIQTTITGRGWLVNPFTSYLPIELTNSTTGLTYTDFGPRTLPTWVPFMSILPAFLLFLVLFIETEICELIMLEKTKKKGGGLHWDIVLLCFINTLGAIFGGPWICAATVRGVAHVSALTVMSTTHAPGEAPHIVEVKDQRVSFLLISLLLGVSVVLAPVLSLVPFAVLYGVFLYMGASGIGGIQMFDRLFLLLVPVKHHPSVGYARRVKTWKMHLFTIIQFSGLGLLWGVKESPAALAFPFFVVSMIALRWSLKFIFTEKELDHLDGPNAGKVINPNEEEDEKDFYEEGIGG